MRERLSFSGVTSHSLIPTGWGQLLWSCLCSPSYHAETDQAKLFRFPTCRRKTVLFRVLQRKRTNRRYTHTHTRPVYIDPWTKQGLGALTLCTIENPCITYSWPSKHEVSLYPWFCVHRVNQPQSCSTVASPIWKYSHIRGLHSLNLWYIYMVMTYMFIYMFKGIHIFSEREREVFRNWLTWLWGLESPQSAGQDGKLEIREELMLQLKSKGNLKVEIPLPGGKYVFFPLS